MRPGREARWFAGQGAPARPIPFRLQEPGAPQVEGAWASGALRPGREARWLAGQGAPASLWDNEGSAPGAPQLEGAWASYFFFIIFFALR